MQQTVTAVLAMALMTTPCALQPRAACAALADPAPAATAPATETEQVAGPLDAGRERLDAPKTHAAERHGTPRTAGQAIDAEVGRLTRLLDLDAGQQARLRRILQSRNSRMRSVWKDNPSPDADRIRPTIAIMESTRDQIRSILTDEQRLKYPAAVPREQLGPATADLDHWLRLTHPQEPHSGAPAN